MVNNNSQETTVPDTVEIRAFMFLRDVFRERNWPIPYYFKLERECNSIELATMLNLPLEKIEAVFINHKAYPLGEGLIKPGDRVAFLPPGTPGPHRVLVGIKKL